jgi:hypothetical protein
LGVGLKHHPIKNRLLKNPTQQPQNSRKPKTTSSADDYYYYYIIPVLPEEDYKK